MEFRDLLLLGTMVSQTTALEFLVIVNPGDSEDIRTIKLNIDCSFYEQLGGDRLIVNWGDGTRSYIVAYDQKVTHTFTEVKKQESYKVRVITPNGKCPTRLHKDKPICNRVFALNYIGEVIDRGGNPETDFSHYVEGTPYWGNIVGIFKMNPQIKSLAYAFSNLANVSSDYSSISSESFVDLPNLEDVTSIFENSNFTNAEEGLFKSNTKINKVTNAFRNTKLINTHRLFENNAGVSVAGIGYSQYTFADNQNLNSLDENSLSGLQNIVDLTAWYQNTPKLTNIPVNLFNNLDNPSKISYITFMFKSSGITNIPDNLIDKLTSVRYITETFRDSRITNIPDNLFDKNVNAVGLAGTFSFTPISDYPEDLFQNNTRVISFGASRSSPTVTGIFESTRIKNIHPATFISNSELVNIGGLLRNSLVDSSINFTFNPKITYAKGVSSEVPTDGVFLLPKKTVTATTFENLTEEDLGTLRTELVNYWFAGTVELKDQNTCVIRPTFYTKYHNPPERLQNIEVTKSGFNLVGADGSRELQIWDYTSKSWKNPDDDLTDYFNLIKLRVNNRHPVCVLIRDDLLVNQIVALYNGYYGTNIDPKPIYDDVTLNDKITKIIELYNGYYNMNLNPSNYFAVDGLTALNSFNSIHTGYYSED